MAKLVLLGGPTGIGKTTVMRILHKRMSQAGFLDADDAWRVSEDVAIEANRAAAISNVIYVMRGYFEAGCETGILSWVFARSALYQPVIDGLKDVVQEIDQLYLTASWDELENRLGRRGDKKPYAYSKSRMVLIDELPYCKIDTTGLSPEDVATEIVSHIQRGRHGLCSE
jgi:gluconate kinase